MYRHHVSEMQAAHQRQQGALLLEHRGEQIRRKTAGANLISFDLLHSEDFDAVLRVEMTGGRNVAL